MFNATKQRKAQILTEKPYPASAASSVLRLSNVKAEDKTADAPGESSCHY